MSTDKTKNYLIKMTGNNPEQFYLYVLVCKYMQKQ